MKHAGETSRPHVEHPSHPVKDAYLEPILFLAARMAKTDPANPPPEKPILDELAELLGLQDFQKLDSIRKMTEDKACSLLNNERSKKAALVTMALVLKVDTTGGEKPRAYFSKIREKLQAEAVAVPHNLDEHRHLVIEYLKD